MIWDYKKKRRNSNSSYVFKIKLKNGAEQIAVVHSPTAQFEEAKGRLKRNLKKNKVEYRNVVIIGQCSSTDQVLIYGI